MCGENVHAVCVGLPVPTPRNMKCFFLIGTRTFFVLIFDRKDVAAAVKTIERVERRLCGRFATAGKSAVFFLDR